MAHVVKRLAEWLADPRTQVKFNGACMVLWFVMVPVTLLEPTLRTAILYVALMSVWANFATHLGGWIAALVNVRAERVEANTDQATHFARIEQTEKAITKRLDRMAREHGAQLAELLELARFGDQDQPAAPQVPPGP